MSPAPLTEVERSRLAVEEELHKVRASRERAMDQKYNLLRVSERRWAVVRVSKVFYSVMQPPGPVSDVLFFEMVTEPLTYDKAYKTLVEKRRKA
jgi:hypothetical protein